MSRYASNTSVSVEKTRGEIERTLARWGATSFAYGWQGNSAQVMFEANSRRIRFTLPLPDRAAREFTHTPGRDKLRSPTDSGNLWEQACRQRWRALGLAIKAKLEAVECGISTFEEEFLSHICLPNGDTVGRWMMPQIEHAYASGKMPPMLSGPRA
jgi:hypothetical protein